MALIKCSECGREVSDQANACPNCGCPIKINKVNENENISVLNNCHIESGKKAEQVDALCLGGMLGGIVSFFIDFFGLVSAVALVISIIGFTRANGKSKTFAIVGIIVSGIELILKIIQLINLISLGY